MKLTITNRTPSTVSVGGRVGVVKGITATTILTVAELEALQPKLVALAAAGKIAWTTSPTDDAADDAAEGSVLGLPTWIPDPPAARNADARISALVQEPISNWAPTANRKIDIRDAPYSLAITVLKSNTAAFSLTLDVTTGGNQGWTTPAGLNTDYVLFGSGNAAAGSWLVRIDKPRKTVLVTPVA